MRSFREEYQREMDQAGVFRLDAKRVSDEIHHRKMKSVRRRRAMISAVSAAAVFLLVGGMATAMNYGGGFIQVHRNGFSITSHPAADEDKETAAEDAGRDLISARERPGPEEEIALQSLEEMEIREYGSLDAFWEECHVTVPLPDMELVGGDGTDQYIHMLNDQVHIRIEDGQERYFSILQVDRREYQAYASSSAYSGEAANERNYTTAQGYTYRVIDIVEDGEVSSIECAISLYGRDLLVGFRGYTQEEAYEVLQTMDLSVYSTDE